MTAGVYITARSETPRRDIDLFGPTTVRIDHRASPDAAPVPLLYLSAYVDDPDRLAQRIIGALSWADDAQAAQAVQDAQPPAPVQPASVSVAAYAMPEFVEDVDYDERLLIPEDVSQTDWKAWSAAMVNRVKLANTAGQLAALEGANEGAMAVCPWRDRSPLMAALSDAYEVTHDQAATS